MKKSTSGRTVGLGDGDAESRDGEDDREGVRERLRCRAAMVGRSLSRTLARGFWCVLEV
jgi:hypothetical protein